LGSAAIGFMSGSAPGGVTISGSFAGLPALHAFQRRTERRTAEIKPRGLDREAVARRATGFDGDGATVPLASLGRVEFERHRRRRNCGKRRRPSAASASSGSSGAGAVGRSCRGGPSGPSPMHCSGFHFQLRCVCRPAGDDFRHEAGEAIALQGAVDGRKLRGLVAVRHRRRCQRIARQRTSDIGAGVVEAGEQKKSRPAASRWPSGRPRTRKVANLDGGGDGGSEHAFSASARRRRAAGPANAGDVLITDLGRHQCEDAENRDRRTARTRAPPGRLRNDRH